LATRDSLKFQQSTEILLLPNKKLQPLLSPLYKGMSAMPQIISVARKVWGDWFPFPSVSIVCGSE